jgi:hypothetical protein
MKDETVAMLVERFNERRHTFIVAAFLLHPCSPVFGKRLLFRVFMYVKRARRVRELRGARAVLAQILPLFS